MLCNLNICDPLDWLHFVCFGFYVSHLQLQLSSVNALPSVRQGSQIRVKPVGYRGNRPYRCGSVGVIYLRNRVSRLTTRYGRFTGSVLLNLKTTATVAVIETLSVRSIFFLHEVVRCGQLIHETMSLLAFLMAKIFENFPR
jgi:hypothetical protein